MAYPHKSVSLDVLRKQVESSKSHIWKLNHDSNYMVEFDMAQEFKTNEVVTQHFMNISSEPRFPGNYCEAMKQLDKYKEERFEGMKKEYEESMKTATVLSKESLMIKARLEELENPPPSPPAVIETPVRSATEKPASASAEMDDETWRLMQQQIEHNNELLRLLHEDNLLKDQILDIVEKRISERVKKQSKLAQRRHLGKKKK